MGRRLAVLGVIVAAALLVAAGCSDDVGGAAPEGERRAAPSFSLPGLDSGTVTLRQFRGTPVVINFWASYCEPCKEEMPDLAEFARETPGVAVVGVAVNDRPSDSRAFARAVGVPFPLAVDRDAETAGEYGVIGLPVTVLVDRDGRIVTTVTGPVGPDDLARMARDVDAAPGATTPS